MFGQYGGIGAPGRRGPALGDGGDPTASGDVVASYSDYDGAQRAVDHLSDNDFPVEHTAIVGADLRVVESVLGRLTAGRAAAAGAASGAWFGLLIGLFLGIFARSGSYWLWLVFWGLVWGVVAGALFGWVGYRSMGGRRDFASTSRIVAARYDVVVEHQVAERARTILGRRDL